MPSKHYKRAGVDDVAANDLVSWITKAARGATSSGVVAGIGGFAGVYEVPGSNGSQLLVGCTDGVGTKLKLAFQMNRHDTVGIDLVAMSVNDLITTGAQPLFFLDYLAVGKLKSGVAKGVVKGVMTGCKQSGCALLGGETAQLPDFYQPGEYDLAGFAVGMVSRKDLIDGTKVKPGNVLIGLPSSGIHSNGYSLVRSIVKKKRKRLTDRIKGLPGKLGDALIEPTRIYVKQLQKVFRQAKLRKAVHAIAHITGGGITGNLVRGFPANCGARIEKSSWTPHPVFNLLAEWGGVSETEMFEVFNMGIGMVLAVDKKLAVECKRALGAGACVIGEVVKGKREVELL